MEKPSMLERRSLGLAAATAALFTPRGWMA